MSKVYSKSGVNYDLLDPIKRRAQKSGLETAVNLKNTGFNEIKKSRGESAYVLEYHDAYFVLVEECLGTKSLVADETIKFTGKTYYDLLAQDTVAYMVNDLITVGARPLSIAAYWAVGSSEWFKDKKRSSDLITGWAKACDLAGASWGGGETPSLSGIIDKNAIDLAGACFGIVKPKQRLILGDKLKEGDSIIFLESRGIQSNGVSLARKIAKQLSKGYATLINKKLIYGEALLIPTIIYSKIIQDLFSENIDIHYMSNITGHGWRKIMRANKQLTYSISTLPYIPEVFYFMQEKAKLSDKDMYATFNMGAGFAIYVNPKDAEKVVIISNKNNIKAWIAGNVEKGEKQVIIKPLNIVYKQQELTIR
ncbi:phosphoribosylformylglycinamidine cyclo-ligase [Candidatus Gottesmanbacteria bacterium RIFCSPHIGHO2_01_FULL_39_10]|uniref:Phosphoribosylformylglycinamidine cyclo-ligase n=1 Tax=Candidatus Gottesmanbacteria bacterium RIFCSPHIGHO2_01_FULL_39_10 TaxID=1798375 RepID=A0A1F5ZKL5_9BACT|nr:MAG: phosphoribosylformylglycinamidine cyclo-ligase [Candidatus Gottesmanbacteria bacterium RIFCSPHIGHO2_01_FULL_39_10]